MTKPFHLSPNIPAGGKPEALRVLHVQSRDKRLARNALNSITVPPHRHAA
jgi:hypothetical protein